MIPSIHLYERLSNQLGTTYFLDKNDQFSIAVDMSDENSPVVKRIQEIASHFSSHGPARGLDTLVKQNSVVLLTQIPNEFGWFKVSAQTSN